MFATNSDTDFAKHCVCCKNNFHGTKNVCNKFWQRPNKAFVCCKHHSIQYPIHVLMYVCMCVCVYVCMYICMCVGILLVDVHVFDWMCVFAWHVVTCAHACVYVCMYWYMYLHECMYVFASHDLNNNLHNHDMCACMHALYVLMYVWYVCMFHVHNTCMTHMHTAYMHTRTHVHAIMTCIHAYMHTCVHTRTHAYILTLLTAICDFFLLCTRSMSPSRLSLPGRDWEVTVNHFLQAVIAHCHFLCFDKFSLRRFRKVAALMSGRALGKSSYRLCDSGSIPCRIWVIIRRWVSFDMWRNAFWILEQSRSFPDKTTRPSTHTHTHTCAYQA